MRDVVAPRSDKRPERARLSRLLLFTAALQIVGRAVDGWWHANHDEFEGARQQLEAHWLIWLGVLATLAVCLAALRRLDRVDRAMTGYRITLISGALYAAVAVWHFIEHANRNDPAVAHVLLAIGQAGMLVGIVTAVVLTRRWPDPVEPAALG